MSIYSWYWDYFLLQDKKEKWISMFRDLFVFFANSRFKHVFKEHLHYLVRSFKISPVHILSKFFTDEGALIYFVWTFVLVLNDCLWKLLFAFHASENKYGISTQVSMFIFFHKEQKMKLFTSKNEKRLMLKIINSTMELEKEKKSTVIWVIITRYMLDDMILNLPSPINLNFWVNQGSRMV